ncbi:MAG TPA: hypothetical protein PLU53_00270 [Bacteroidia bacterium]|nr:hypothetical protein [Bacteroidia bacterium]
MNRFLRIFLFLTAFLPFSQLSGQEAPEYKKNALALDLTQYGINEINLNYEHFFSIRRSIEFTASLVYVNDPLAEFGRSFTNSHYFEEHGFGARIAYKLYKPQVEDSRWRDYIAPGLIYKYLYYNNQWFENETTNAKGDKYTEAIYQHRFRHKFGLEFVWGKVYDMNKSFAFELYYGVGLRGTLSSRTDIQKQDTVGVSKIYDVNFQDDNFYIRPTLRGGVKFRFSF